MPVAEFAPVIDRTLDRKLRKVIDYDTFGRNIVASMLLEAKKQGNNGNGEPHVPINVQVPATLQLNTDPITRMYLVTVETENGKCAVSI